MAGPSTREANPRGNAPAGTSGVDTSVPTIVVLLLLGLTLRLIIAYVLLPGSGFPTDLSSFQGWSGQLVAQTPLGFYDKAGFLDYPPVYLLFLWVLGLVFAPFGGVGESIKLIPIVTDLALAFVVWRMAQELGASRWRALIAATIVLINPVTWFNSAIWGQADVVGSVFMLLGLWALLRDRRELAAVFAVVAALTKIQLGILGILVGFVILRRSLAPREGPADPQRVLTSIASGLASAALICLPFTGLDFIGLAARLATVQGLLTLAVGAIAGLGVYLWVRRSELVSTAYRELAAAGAGVITVVGFTAMVFGSIVSHIVNTFGEYPWLTLNAYNPWALVADESGSGMDRNLGWIHDAQVFEEGVAQQYFNIGPFASDLIAKLAVLVVVLAAVAAVAWLWARRMDFQDQEAVPAASVEPAYPVGAREPIEPAPELPKPVLSVPSELRAVAVGCVVVAGAVAFLLAGQTIGGLPAAIVGDGLLLAILVGVSLWAAWRDDRLSIVVALAILAIAFFVAPTRAHERYLFPFFAVGAILLAVSWRWSVAYVVLALVNTANLLAVLIEYKGIPGVQGADGTAGPISGLLGDWGNFVKSAEWPAGTIWPIAVSGIVTGLALLWALVQMRTRAVQVLAWEADRAGREPELEHEPESQWEPEPAAAEALAFAETPNRAQVRAAAETPAFADAAASDAAAFDAFDADEEYDASPEREAEFVPAFVMRAWHWVFRPSVMPDRSPSLATEPRGRLNKLDVWVVVALILVILSTRIYRLGEPAGMHFDEVYHARTATEFLQDWRYGIRHDIYEWTHPHLAKYAIAGGLVVFSDDKVTATSNLGVPVKDAVVQPRIVPPEATATDGTTPDARTNADARLGDRLFVATGDAVMAYDLQTRKLEASYPIPGAASLSIAADTGNMFVGTSDGHIWRIDIYSLDYVRLGTEASPAPAKELPTQTGFPIVHLYAGSPPLILAVDASGTIASVDGTGAILAHTKLDGAVDFAPLGTGAATIVRVTTSNPATTPTPTPTPTPTTPASTTPVSTTPTPTPTPTVDVAAEAEAIATALGLTTDEVEAALNASAIPGVEQPVDLGVLTQEQISALRQLIDDGKLPGIDIKTDDPQVMVAYARGVGVMDARFLTVTSTYFTGSIVRTPTSGSTVDVPAEADAIATALGLAPGNVAAELNAATEVGLEQPVDFGTMSQDQITSLQQLIDDGQLPDVKIKNQPATSIALNPNTDQESYVATGASILLVKVSSTGGGSFSRAPDQPLKKMPGEITKIVFDNSNKIAQALGRTPDGSGWTVYAIESNGNAVFSDARLPWEPVAIGADATPQMPNTDRQDLLAFAPNGDMAQVDIGQFAFAWRVVGVLFGALMAVCLYLLARLLFRRRLVGLLVALFSCVDGMLFAQSRIAMNDTYVGGFLLLGYLVFAYLWLGGDKRGFKSWLAFWLGMPLLGVILGLALVSKWVAVYAILSIGILILIRSALGRLVTVLGLVAGTGILGWMSIAEMKSLPDTGNIPELLVGLGVGAGIVIGGVYYAMKRARTTPDRVLFVAVAALIGGAIMFWSMRFYPAPDQNGAQNYTFFLIMFVATAIVSAVNAYHPIAWTKQELQFAIAVPALGGIGAGALGAARGSVTLMAIGAGAIILPAAAFWVAGRLGFGPLATPPTADDPSSFAGPPAPAPEGWLRMGSGFGLPAAWMAACVLILPLVIYIALYIPWAVPWQQETTDSGPLPVLMCWQTDPNDQCASAWPSGHTGQTLMQLTIAMYNYHNDLRATHAASSPWWAWPLDLKPVWFESVTYAQDTGSMIYDGGNPVLWWLSITAMGFVCWQAFKRRSLGLAVIAVAFFWQWLSWSRIDRAAFQYHFYTALPFFLLGLAYFLAELWHGPSRRTWLLARVGVAATILVAPVLWLAKYQVCGLARVGLDDYWRQMVCGRTVGDLRVDTHIFLIAVVLIAALAVLAVTLIRMERRPEDENSRSAGWVFQLVAPVVVAGVLLLWLGAYAPRTLLFEVPLPSDVVALLMLSFLSIMALAALAMRDSRRLVLVFCVSAVIAFVALYPNLSALPMPNNISSVYNGLLPTWLYGFQFADNMQVSSSVSLTDGSAIELSVAVLVVAVLAGYVAWVQRVVNGYRRHQLVVAGLGLSDGAGGDFDGDGGAAGAAGGAGSADPASDAAGAAGGAASGDAVNEAAGPET